MSTHTVRADCLKCNVKESYVFSYNTKDSAFCLNCGWSYETVNRKLSQEELKDLREEYEWKECDKK